MSEHRNDTGGQWWAETERDPVYLTAADWLVRLQNPQVSIEETISWEAWIAADPRHAQAFARIESVSQLMRKLRPPRTASARELTLDTYDAAVPVKEWRASPRRGRSFALAASAALVATGLAVAFHFIQVGRGSAPSSRIIATPIGENRIVALPDGSRISLGGDTQLSVAFDPETRNVTLSRGEALFTVAKDAVRPFKVRTSDATIVALGTQFDVRISTDRSVVSVTEGRVLVEPAAHIVPVALLREFKPGLRPVHLDAGEKTMAWSDGIEQATKIEDLSAATAWQNGQLAFRMEPLRYVLGDVNRYASKEIVLGDERLGDLIVTGMVTQKNVDGWIESLERSFDLRAVKERDRIVLTAR